MAMTSGDYQMRGSRVTGLSQAQIRTSALHVRGVLQIDQVLDLPVFTEKLFHYGITIDVVEDHHPLFALAGVEASCEVESATIYLTATTYEAVRFNVPRARFTICHELGHLLLGHKKLLHRGASNQPPRVFEDSEWQADTWAAEFLMPLDQMRQLNLRSADQIQSKFGVSQQAATNRAAYVQKKQLY